MAEFPSWKCVAAEFGESENAGLVAFWIKMPSPCIDFGHARLIAAAPALYEALKIARANLQFLPPEDVVEQIDSALQAAEGKQVQP